MSGVYHELVTDQEGNVRSKQVREDTNDILWELQHSIDHLKKNRDFWKDEYNKMKAETFKDEKIKELTTKIEELKLEMLYGFPITKNQHDRIQAWMNDWFDRKRGGDRYIGASGGGFTYKFVPTAIGTSGVVIAPDGEKFEFQEIG